MAWSEASAQREGKGGGMELPSCSLGLALRSEVGRGRGSLIRKRAGPGPPARTPLQPGLAPGWARGVSAAHPFRSAAVGAAKGGWRPAGRRRAGEGLGPLARRLPPSIQREAPRLAAGAGARPIWRGSERVCGRRGSHSEPGQTEGTATPRCLPFLGCASVPQRK